MATAGPNAPGTMASDSAVGTKLWASPDNAKVSDNSRTFSGSSDGVNRLSYYLKATNFGFAVSSGATINGITVSLERNANSNSALINVKDSVVSLVKGGTVSGDNKADTATRWPTSDAAVSYGGAADLWGLTLTDTDVNASTFGVVISAALNSNSGKSTIIASVDFISITIDYTTGGGGLSIPVASQSYRQRRTR